MRLSSGPRLYIILAVGVKLNTNSHAQGHSLYDLGDVLLATHTVSPLVKGAYQKNIFFYFSTKTYVVGTQKNRLNETVLLSTQNIC